MASSSSSVRIGGWTYDVFLSFRGEDTRNNFVDHLHTSLVQKGIRVFKDDKMLRKGNPISSDLLKAIEESRFAVVVFSENYANSSWCLDELTKIMECQDRMGQKVLPVFYHVDPSDVRGQKTDFATAFQQHEEKFREEMDKVNMWRKALAAAGSLSGWHISTVNGGESLFIDKIVQEISSNIQPHGMEKNLIDIESRIDELTSLLGIEATHEKCAAVDHVLSICIPRSKIPSWFQEQQDGCNISLKLPPKCDTDIMGFAVCAVSQGYWNINNANIHFRVGLNRTFIPDSEFEYEKESMWIVYIPFSLFRQQMYDEFGREDWFRFVEGNLMISIAKPWDRCNKIVRCGAHIVYKEDVESIQQINTCIPDYGNLNIARTSDDYFTY